MKHRWYFLFLLFSSNTVISQKLNNQYKIVSSENNQTIEITCDKEKTGLNNVIINYKKKQSIAKIIKNEVFKELETFNGNFDKLHCLLNWDPSLLGLKDDQNNNLLQKAIISQRVKLFTPLLILSRPTINIDTSKKETIKASLLDINSLNENNESSLMLTFKKPWTEEEKYQLSLAKSLLEFGAETRTIDNKGNYPLSYAIENKNFELIKIYIEYGGVVDNLDENYNNIFHLIVKNKWNGNDFQFFLNLLSKNRLLDNIFYLMNKTNIKGMSPLYFAVSMGIPDRFFGTPSLFYTMINRGAELNAIHEITETFEAGKLGKNTVMVETKSLSALGALIDSIIDNKINLDKLNLALLKKNAKKLVNESDSAIDYLIKTSFSYSLDVIYRLLESDFDISKNFVFGQVVCDKLEKQYFPKAKLYTQHFNESDFLYEKQMLIEFCNE